MAYSEHTALDGATVRIDSSNGLDLTQPFASFAAFRVGTKGQSFTSGLLKHGEGIATSRGIPLDEIYSYSGGSLRTGSIKEFEEKIRLEYTVRLAIWEGASFSLKTTLYNADASSVIALLDQFQMAEAASGIVLHPAGKGVVPDKNRRVKVVQNVPGLGLLEVFELTPATLEIVPDWEGTIVPGGELFAEDLGSENATFLLVGENSIVRLYPNWWEAGIEDVIDGFSEISASWERASP